MNSRAERAASYSATEWWDKLKVQEERSATSAKAVIKQNFIVANPFSQSESGVLQKPSTHGSFA